MKTDIPQLKVAAAFKKQQWQSILASKNTYSTVQTGFDELDQSLQLGGWPLGVITEIGLIDYGIGELRLLMPALREVLSNSAPYTVWIAPPYLPYAPALVKECLNLENLIIVRPDNVTDALWASEQALQVDTCAAVFCWTERYALNQKETRRLQLAAEKSNTWFVQFRHSDCLQQASAARLRLHLQSNARGTLDIGIHKQPQGYAQQCSVSLSPHYELWQRIPVELLPKHNQLLTTNQAGNKRWPKQRKHKARGRSQLPELGRFRGIFRAGKAR